MNSSLSKSKHVLIFTSPNIITRENLEPVIAEKWQGAKIFHDTKNHFFHAFSEERKRSSSLSEEVLWNVITDGYQGDAVYITHYAGRNMGMGFAIWYWCIDYLRNTEIVFTPRDGSYATMAALQTAKELLGGTDAHYAKCVSKCELFAHNQHKQMADMLKFFPTKTSAL